MNLKSQFLTKSLTSIIDQILLSGLNFIVGAILIKFATKETFGLYTQLFALALLAATLLDSIIGSALTTICGALTDIQKSQLIYRVMRIQWFASALLGIVAALGILIFNVIFDLYSNPLILALAFSFYVITLGNREYCRTAFFIQLQPELAVKIDFVFVAVTLLGAVFLTVTNSTSVENFLLLLSVANFTGTAIYSKILVNITAENNNNDLYITDIKRLWTLGRWAVIGSGVGWIGNNGYLYFTSGMLGVVALADLNAARLVLIPISIVGIAWARIARPVFGRIIHENDWKELRLFLIRSFIAIEIFTILYVFFLINIFPWMSLSFYGGKYANISMLLLLWGVYFTVYVARNVGTTLLASYGKFKEMFFQGLISLLVFFLVSYIFISNFGIYGVLYAMIAVEVWDAAITFLYMLPRARAIRV